VLAPRLTAGLPVIRVLPQEEERARAIIGGQRDRDWSLCVAISFAVLEARGVRTAFSFDRHFRQHGRFQVIGLES
jgi:predicted nucleic acid-binding protein